MDAPTGPVEARADQFVLWLRAAFRPAAVVFIGGWVFAFRGGMGGSLALIGALLAAACLLGGLAGGLVGASPAAAGVTLSALSAAAVGIVLLDAGRHLRRAALGPDAEAALGGALPWFGALALLAAFGGAALGLVARRAWDARRARRTGPPH